MDENDRLPFALLAVGQGGSIDAGGLGGPERGARHAVILAYGSRFANPEMQRDTLEGARDRIPEVRKA
jgi:hypothetical protein